MGRRFAGALACLLLSGWVSDDPASPLGDPRAVHEDCASDRIPPGARRVAPPAIPSGRAIGTLERARCEAALRDRGVAFQRVPADEAPGVEQPIRVVSALGGVRIVSRGSDETSPHAIADCRLALAILAWAPALRARGIARIEHASIYRPGARVRGTRRISGHAHGLAIDAVVFVLDDGARLPVLDAWVDRARGADPCAERGDDDLQTARLRGAICAAVQQDLFQVVLTPHHDEAHANHVHLEIRPGLDEPFVR
jgi:hypothetical protein